MTKIKPQGEGNWERYRPTGMAVGLPDDICMTTRDLVWRNPHTRHEVQRMAGGVIRVEGPGARAKTFKGETAWMRAESYAYDISSKMLLTSFYE